MKIIGSMFLFHLVIFFAALAISLSFVIRGEAEKQGGAAVGSRFLEGPDGLKALVNDKLPLPAPALDAKDKEPDAGNVAEKLTTWVKNNEKAARTYASPVLLRYDIVFLLALGLFLAIALPLTAAPYALKYLPHPFGVVLLVVLALPGALYIVIDLAEDIRLAGYLTHPETITEQSVGFTVWLTAIKIELVKYGIGLTLLASLAAAIGDVCGAFRP